MGIRIITNPSIATASNQNLMFPISTLPRSKAAKIMLDCYWLGKMILWLGEWYMGLVPHYIVPMVHFFISKTYFEVKLFAWLNFRRFHLMKSPLSVFHARLYDGWLTINEYYATMPNKGVVRHLINTQLCSVQWSQQKHHGKTKRARKWAEVKVYNIVEY